MRRSIADHEIQPWRVHEFAADFELLDVWRFPVQVRGDLPLETFLDFLQESQSELRGGSGLAAQLFRLRRLLGRIFGWDRDASESPEVDESGAKTVVGFAPVYSTEDEAVFEIENATVHALMHLGRVRLGDGDLQADWAPQMAVYVKKRGRLGRVYMALISPFRHYIVYPAMMRSAERAWPGYASRILGVLLALCICVADAEAQANDVYSPGGWATLHRGPANRKWVPDAPLANEYDVWTALSGAAVLTAPTMSPDGRRLYVTTGRSVGHSNLHAFDLEGEPLWQSPPWQDADHGLDPCAILSSAIVDAGGDLYIGDCNQLFAFRSDGSRKWVVPLPGLRDGDWNASSALSINALTTAIFTREGHVLGVTNFGDVIVVDRDSGISVAAPMRLPGLLPPPSTTPPMTESILSKGLVDPEIREWAWQLLFGGAMRSANTPAIDWQSGRIFVAASSTTAGQGALYALDLESGKDGLARLEIAFATEMGPGSGSSPALSMSGDVVYVSDEKGMFYAVDARSGRRRWQVQTRSTSAAAAVGGNGDIYSLQADGPTLVAMTREGRIRWQSDLGSLAAATLPSSWLLGDPVAVGNGNPTVVGEVVLVPVAYGYRTELGRKIPWLVHSSLVAIDVESGVGLRNVLTLADDSTGVTSVLPDGTIINSLGTVITSGLEPLATIAAWLLPSGLHLLGPVGGIQVSRPSAELP